MCVGDVLRDTVNNFEMIMTVNKHYVPEAVDAEKWCS